MIRIYYLQLTIWIVLLGICTHSASAQEDLETTITYLLTYVKNADVVFIRNNREHTPEEAVAHIQTKYEHFKDQIKTPEDFIRFAGSKSLLSGKPYQVRMRDGKTMLTQKWLEDALAEYRTEGAVLK